MRAYRILVVAWNSDFFVELVNSLGKFICVDDKTASGTQFNVTRLILEVPFNFRLGDFYPVYIEGKICNLILRGECGASHICSANPIVSH